MEGVEDAERRLERFAPFIMKCFPETKERNGIIESVLTPVPKMKDLLNEKYDSNLEGNLLLKQDSHLAIAGSIKARGGIYEILKHTEELALEHGFLSLEDNYEKLASEECREFFKKYTIQVGSTGNLGLSIGIMSAAVGYQVIVHMSADAKQWKKDLLRSHGVTVKEYESDYSEAVKNGRALSDADPNSYFVDDENSKTLFLGYAVAAKRLQKQLEEKNVAVDEEHPLFVYIPCGVGGAPGGVCFGLKLLFGDYVHCFFIEPTQAPCMLVGMATGLNQEISVQDIGLTTDNGIQGFYGAFLPDRSLMLSISCQAENSLESIQKDGSEASGMLIEPDSSEKETVRWQILFPSLDNAIDFCKILGYGQASESRLYKDDGVYYLMVDFPNTEDGNKKAQRIVSAGEFGGMAEKDAISEAYLNEHEKCLLNKDAINILCKM